MEMDLRFCEVFHQFITTCHVYILKYNIKNDLLEIIKPNHFISAGSDLSTCSLGNCFLLQMKQLQMQAVFSHL